MALRKVLHCIIFGLALAEVTSWTIDLPEVRKYIFEKNEKEEREKKYEDFKYKNEDKPLFYSNIEGNSKHNTKHFDSYENTAYAREYGYESYMEKKVNDIVYNGSVYLDGLRRSLEHYTGVLENCTRANTTSSLRNTTVPATGSPSNSSRCRETTRSSEHVSRLTELAMWATRELQDVAYARKYKKDDDHSLRMQENELILKLAWFLDRLAHYTGYEPEPKDFVRNTEQSTTSSTLPPTPASLVSASPETERLMMECLQQNSSEPAVDRCRYPEPLPPIVQLMMQMNSNITGIPSMPQSSSNDNQQVVPISQTDSNPEQSMELLITADYRTPSSNLPSLTDYRHVQKRSLVSMPSLTSVRHVKKRSIFNMPSLTTDLGLRSVRHVKKRSVFTVVGPERIEKLKNAPKLKRLAKTEIFPKSLTENDPAVHFLKYYAKHKVWEGANTKNFNSKTFPEYEVKNQLTHKTKRAIDNKKYHHLKLPENPYQDLSKYIKHKPGIKYIKDNDLAEKIKAALKKMDEKKPSKSLRKLTKKILQKRSIKHEKDVDMPRESVDPQKDISYYVKNKPGRNYNNDLVQAVQVRTGLEQIFNTGNIEVVRRYGANYNPLIPAPFFAGVIKSQADFKK